MDINKECGEMTNTSYNHKEKSRVECLEEELLSALFHQKKINAELYNRISDLSNKILDTRFKCNAKVTEYAERFEKLESNVKQLEIKRGENNV